MTDEELMTRFEAGTVEPGRFGHREHLRVTWLYLRRCGRPQAERRLLSGLRGLAMRAGKPDRFSARLTLAWIDRIDRARIGLGEHSFEDLLRLHPELGERTACMT
jgi:hypothetical protein